ncbi:Rieske (2Fe-2S) protein [Streptomyces beijiangensis]|uniref:Cytochrome bc1 complex Rieske iron-sulfur subunit n=1 Tax=Streptomyces beijiangensis TaxID=163361 RepID=A0A939F2Z9_9ACTN|nr:Rieske (2Fe-2S) protein [Streptomyces beijiangensis]MBO0510449.1 Rieske (2Fe-2S) protein [Streptomyces beijiangensis]
MTSSQESLHTFDRRTVVTAVGAAGIAAVTLTACGSSDKPGGSEAVKPAPAGGNGDALAKTADIPQGGGKVFADQGVVVTQPSAGQFKAFSSKCTHQGCAVSKISDGTITCPCHGSQFDASDGSVKKGPATEPLAAAAIKVEGDSITLG